MALLLLAAAPASASGLLGLTAFVTNGADAGPGSFRAAIERANADSRVRSIRFAPGLSVALSSDVVYSGRQGLLIDGNGSEVVGDPAATPAATWDGGLLASVGGANLALHALAFRGSFNNGVAVFVPPDRRGEVSVALDRIAIESSRFHGLYVDGQVTTGFNTDDVPHPDCVDPWPFEGPAKLVVRLSHSKILRNGTLAGGFDIGVPIPGQDALTGCPADFDGVRVDDGAGGGILGAITSSALEDNLADGAELDERGDASVVSSVLWTSLARNGDTGTADPDDGIDIDESGAGDILAFFAHVSVVDNFDEGIDLSEVDAGSASVVILASEASRNEDEGIKVDELADGDLSLLVQGSSVNGSLSQDGIELLEEDAGDLTALLIKTDVQGNDDAALLAEQVAPGAGRLTTVGGDLTGNGDPSVDLTGVEATTIGTAIDQ
jgi:hypothetical protein